MTASRGLLCAGAVLLLAGGMLTVGVAVGAPEATRPTTALARPTPVAAGDALTRSITALQTTLRRVPRDDQSWATLGAAYVQKARLTADPTWYAKADGAFARSLQLRPTGNDGALAGQGGLAASRHAFATGLQLADRALTVNPYSSAALAVKTDCLAELGRYADSRAVLARLLALHPGVAAFSRASYAFELQGQVAPARSALERAAEVADAPADKAFAHYYLGELAWNNGDVAAAAAAYDTALTDDPSYVPPLTGRAKVRAAHGDTTGAIADYTAAVQRQPQPATLLELGELLEATGDRDGAQEQYAVLRATQKLYASQGQVVDAELALFEADHGSPARALTLARRAYAARPDSVVAEDAYAWALHAAGRDREALPLSRRALRNGQHSPAFGYHLGVVEAAVGDRGAARTALRRALTLNPAFSPLQAPRARELLDHLG